MSAKAVALIPALLVLAACSSPPAVNTGAVSSTSSAAPVKQVQATPTWGQRYTWPNGVAIELGTPTGCTPSKDTTPKDIARAVAVKITVVNGSAEPLSTDTLEYAINAQFNGQKADRILDYGTGGQCGGGIEGATVLAGKTFTGTLAFAVGAAPGELQIGLQQKMGQDTAVYVGQA